MGAIRKRLGAARRRLATDQEQAATPSVPELEERFTALRNRIAVLEREVQESRELNRRIAELTDIVTELLIPVAQRDEARMNELLGKYRHSL